MHTIEYLKENHIDVEKSLELLGDIETYDEILEEFYNNIEEKKKKLKEYLQSDIENYTVEVHSLKSDSKYLGFTTLAEIALEHQTRGENKDESYLKEHFEELQKEIDKIIAIIKKYREE